ncbi:hypothetical protein D3C87_1903900 [compost metagenome]
MHVLGERALAGECLINEGFHIVPDIGPDDVKRLAERTLFLQPKKRAVGVVVDDVEVRPPEQTDCMALLEDHLHGGFE